MRPPHRLTATTTTTDTSTSTSNRTQHRRPSPDTPLAFGPSPPTHTPAIPHHHRSTPTPGRVVQPVIRAGSLPRPHAASPSSSASSSSLASSSSVPVSAGGPEEAEGRLHRGPRIAALHVVLAAVKPDGPHLGRGCGSWGVAGWGCHIHDDFRSEVVAGFAKIGTQGAGVKGVVYMHAAAVHVRRSVKNDTSVKNNRFAASHTLSCAYGLSLCS